jgi:hypothetical protein
LGQSLTYDIEIWLELISVVTLRWIPTILSTCFFKIGLKNVTRVSNVSPDLIIRENTIVSKSVKILPTINRKSNRKVTVQGKTVVSKLTKFSQQLTRSQLEKLLYSFSRKTHVSTGPQNTKITKRVLATLRSLLGEVSVGNSDKRVVKSAPAIHV